MSASVPAVEADGLTKAFGDDRVLDGIDLALSPGEITLLMGPNGEGKTVLLCCLGGGLRPTTGRVLVRGRPAHRAGDALSLLLQGSVGLPALTAPENARFYAALHPASTGRWPELLGRLELDDRATILKHCSGGMRRKVALAVALDPAVSVYLLDEPTAALDLGALHTLHRVLRERRDAGRAVVLTSHSPLDARLADRLVFVRDGRIVADAVPGGLLEALPPVVRVRGAVHEAVPRIAPLLRAGHNYGTGPELRGFLRRDRSVGEVAAAVADCDVRVDRDEPTTIDLYEHLATVEAG